MLSQFQKYLNVGLNGGPIPAQSSKRRAFGLNFSRILWWRLHMSLAFWTWHETVCNQSIRNIKKNSQTYHLCSSPFLQMTACIPSKTSNKVLKEYIQKFGSFRIVDIRDTARRQCKKYNRRTPKAFASARRHVYFSLASMKL